MSWFPPFHTAEQVAEQLIAGLEDGSITLDAQAPRTPHLATDTPPRVDALPNPTPVEVANRPQMDIAPRG